MKNRNCLATTEAANYPYCTIDPNVGIVIVPDERLYVLQKIAKTGVVIPAAVEFVDIAGLVKGASQGEGLGNKFLARIREVDAIVQVVRCFEDADVHHVAGSVDFVRDIEVITTELVLSDLEAVQKRLNSVAKEAKRGDKEALAQDGAHGLLRRRFLVATLGVLGHGVQALLHCFRSDNTSSRW